MIYQPNDAPPITNLSDRLKWVCDRIIFILLHGDITFACAVLGMAMIMWGVLGLSYTSDLKWFASGFVMEVAPWFWGINHMAAGYAFIHCALHHFPPGRSLMFGSYCVMCWTWIAMGRPAASFSSGMTLNFVIILMGAILIQRSGKKL